MSWASWSPRDGKGHWTLSRAGAPQHQELRALSCNLQAAGRGFRVSGLGVRVEGWCLRLGGQELKGMFVSSFPAGLMARRSHGP